MICNVRLSTLPRSKGRKLEPSLNAKYIREMTPRMKSFLADVGAIGIVVGALVLLFHPQWVGLEPSLNDNQEIATATNGIGTSTVAAQSASANSAVATTAPRKNIAKPPLKSAPITPLDPSTLPPYPPASASATTTDSFSIARIENPYPFPPQSFEVTNNQARLALVNILCGARSGTFKPISASGVIIDSRGVILTNAHVAQYFLLSADPTVDLSCVIRAGSPAYPAWNAEVLFMPPAWVKAHASDLTKARPVGTGEYDYALLRITGSVSGQPLSSLPFVPIDTREAIGFKDDSVLVASYPAEFVGGISTQLNLYPVSSITDIKNMLTFDNKTVDVISLGGIIGAQSGSSGGAVVNAWGRLVGVISTTSDGATTDARDLHAITLSYINRNIATESGLDLQSILGGDVASEADAFNANTAPALRQLFIDQIKPR